MYTDGADVILTSEELHELARSLAPGTGRLDLLPPPDGVDGANGGAEAALAELPVAEYDMLRWALPVLRAPAKTMVVRTSLADEVVTQQALAWSAEPGQDLALLNPGAADNGTSTWRLGRRSPFAVRTMMRAKLAADAGLPTEALNVPLPTQGVVTLLAIVDHLRYARRYAELVYEPPVVSFTPHEILARIGDAEIDDFRWPLLFFEKLTPPGALSSYTAEAVAAGLQALQETDLIESLADKPPAAPAPDQLYQLLPAGEAIADGLLHEVSKVGLTVSQCLPGITAPDGDPGVGQDVALLVRGATRIVLILVSGKDGAVAFVDGDALTGLLEAWFEAPPAEAVAASRLSTLLTTASPDVQADVEDEPVLNEPLAVPGASRPSAPPEAGRDDRPPLPPHPPSRFCTRCGARLDSTKRFCTQCGAPLAADERSSEAR
jgi:hypothetical protein